MNELKPGIYHGLSSEDYHSLPSLSFSQIKELMKSVAHWEYYLEHPPEVTEAMLKGSLLHMMVLEPGKYRLMMEHDISIKPIDMKFTTKEGKEWKSEQESAGKIIITQEAFDEVEAMGNELLQYEWQDETTKKWNKLTETALTDGESELSFIAYDDVIDRNIRVRPDYIVGVDKGITPTVFEIKTMNPPVYPFEVFDRQMYLRSYYVQQAFYNRGIQLATGLMPNYHYIIAIENKPPHLIKIYSFMAGDTELIQGEMKIFEAYDKLKKYQSLPEKEKHRFWGYPANIERAKIPNWALKNNQIFE